MATSSLMTVARGSVGDPGQVTEVEKDIRVAQEVFLMSHMLPLSGKELADAIAKVKEESMKRKDLLKGGGNVKDQA